MKHYEYEINLFLDNELPYQDRKKLFMHLAVCSECSEMFHQYNKIKTRTHEYFSNIDAADAENITLPAAYIKKNNLAYRKYFYFSSAAAVIFLLLFVFQYNHSAGNISKLHNTEKQFDPVANNSISSGTTTNRNAANHDSIKKVVFSIPEVINLNSGIIEPSINHGENSDSIFLNEDLFNLNAGQNSVQVINDNKKGIQKYFGGDYVDSPSIVSSIKLNSPKNGMSDFEKNIYEQLKTDPGLNSILRDSSAQVSEEYIRKFANLNSVYDNNTRDLKYHNQPFIDKNRKLNPADIALIKDLLLREGDRYKIESVKKKNNDSKNTIFTEGVVEIPIASATFKKEGNLVLTAYAQRDKSNEPKVISFEVVFKGDTLSEQVEKIKIKLNKRTK